MDSKKNQPSAAATRSAQAERIINAALKCDGVELLDPIKFGDGDWENELLFFIKPEVFFLEKASDMRKMVGFILQNIEKFNAKIDGICVVSGSALEKYNIMSKHYNFINVMSNAASVSMDADNKKKIEESFKLAPGKYEILGGHEYLKEFDDETMDGLDKLWFKEKSVKLRSGLYLRHFKKNGREIVLVNGFHPKQLAYFTDNSHKIVLMLLHSNTAWSALKNDMAGATFPEKAAPTSIRGEFYINAKNYGLKPITVENNCVHLSAGPFEAMAEIVNFFGKITNMDIKKQQPLMLKKMLASGIAYSKAIETLGNPAVELASKQTDLFTATEEMDSDKAISIFKETLGKKSTKK